MIIDFHNHLGVDLAEDFQQDGDQLLRLMDEAGVSQALVFAFGGCPDWEEGNATVSAAARTHSDRLLPALTVAPGEVPRPQRAEYPRAVAARVTAEGFRAIVMHPMMHNFRLEHPMVVELCRACGTQGTPVLLHLQSQWVDETSGLPRLVEACPATQFVMPSVYWNAGATALLTPSANVSFDLGKGYAQVTVQPLLKAVGPARLLFASDTPMGSPRLERMKFEWSGVPREDASRILSENAARLLGLAGSGR